MQTKLLNDAGGMRTFAVVFETGDAVMPVASLIGDVALSPEGKPALHIHLVVAKRDGTALAGHFGGGTVRPTLELIVTEQPAHLRKRVDPESGLALIRPAL